MLTCVRRFLAVALVVIALCVPAITQAATRTSLDPHTGPRGNGQHTLLVVGDSLTEGAAAFGQLQQRLAKIGVWQRVVIDAKWGRRGPEGIAALRARLAKNRNITAVVFALGTNDLLSRRQPSYPKWLIHEYNKEFGYMPTLWIDAQYSATHPDWNQRARRFQRVLTNVSASSLNTHHASWFAHFPRTSPWYQFDGVHLSPRGYRLRADFIVEEAKRFGGNVVDSTTTTTTTTVVPPEPVDPVPSDPIPSP